jgi:hypothetical protein
VRLGQEGMCGGKEENTVTQLLVPARDYGNTELGFLSREALNFGLKFFYFFASWDTGTPKRCPSLLSLLN